MRSWLGLLPGTHAQVGTYNTCVSLQSFPPLVALVLSTEAHRHGTSSIQSHRGTGERGRQALRCLENCTVSGWRGGKGGCFLAVPSALSPTGSL